jgi:NADP-dependent 3-hydroxy-3-methylglutaryl-CoA reductase
MIDNPQDNLESCDDRHYYHEGREPKVVFFVNKNSYEGLVSNYWRNGLTISVTGELNVNSKDTVSKVFFEPLEKDNFIENMKVLNYTWNGSTGTGTLQLYAPDPETEQLFEKAFDALFEKPIDDPVDRFEDENMPQFTGREHYSTDAQYSRLAWVRNVSGAELKHLPKSMFAPENVAGNIENYIGSVQIPVGIAGPIRISGTYAHGFIPVPIATTERTLVNSICRGARACNISGGIMARVTGQNIIRTPVFFCRDMYGAINLEKWITNNTAQIIAVAESITSIAKIRYIKPSAYGDSVYVKLIYTTGDSSGWNMTSSCTWMACEFIAGQAGSMTAMKYEGYNLESNMSGVKKANFQSLSQGIGVSAMASCFLSEETIRQVLRCTVSQLIRSYNAFELGEVQIGTIGKNYNFASAIAGIFTATGQDIACVHDSSIGIFQARAEEGGITFTAYLPALVIGTVGGGTRMPTQRDCLKMIACYGEGRSFRLAEIIAATCLALDISTAASIATNEFGGVQEKGDSTRQAKYLMRSDLTPAFFTSLLHDDKTSVDSLEEYAFGSNSAIITTLAQNTMNIQGLYRFVLKLSTPEGLKDLPAVLKVKTADVEIVDMGINLAKLSGEDRIPGLIEAQSQIFGFEKSQERETVFYRKAKPEILKYCPEIYGTMMDLGRNIFAVLMEDLSCMSHLDTVNDISKWSEKDMLDVIGDMAAMHGIYLDRYGEVPKEMKINLITPEDAANASEFLIDLTQYNHRRYPGMISREMEQFYIETLRNASAFISEMDAFPRTVTHNDFNSRNLCLRPSEEKGKPRLILYDWELSAYQNPQTDLLEFLIYTLPAGTDIAAFDRFSDYYIDSFSKHTGRSFDRKTFLHIMYLNAVKMAVIRFNLYLLAHNVAHFPFLERVYGNLTAYIQGKK